MRIEYPVPVFIILMLLLAWEAWIIRRNTKAAFWKSFGIAALMTVVPLVLWFVLAILAGKLGIPGILISIGVAISINTAMLAWLTDTPTKWGLSIAVTAMAYGSIGIFIAVASNPMEDRGLSLMSRAKGTLRSIGSVESVYQSDNRERQYGTFEALKISQDLAEGYTLGNMIDNYSMTWRVNYTPTTVSEEFPSGIMSSFTVIAWPQNKRWGDISTFAVTEDQVVRVFNPKKENKLDSVKTWDPIL